MDDLGAVIGFGVLAIGIMLSRIVSERAFRKLDDPMKLTIMNEFYGMRIWSIVPVLAIVILMFAGNTLCTGHEWIVFSGFFVALIANFIITHRLIRAKMLKVHAPEDYLRTFMRSRWLSYLAIVLMFAVMFGTNIVKALVQHGIRR